MKELTQIIEQAMPRLHGCRGSAIYMIRETLIKYLYRHAGEYQHPVNNCFDWILAGACAGM